MEKIAVITDPSELQEVILRGVKMQIDELKKEFQPKEPTEYLTRNELAKMLKIDLSTVHHWSKSGKLSAYYIGGRVYYKRQEVEEALKPLEK